MHAGAPALQRSPTLAWPHPAPVTALCACFALPCPAAHAYYRTLPFSIAQYRFGAAEGPAAEGHQPFVSAVCWANRSRHCLAANSQGLLQILKLE